MSWLRHLSCAAAMLVTALSAHGQALRQPELLGRYQRLIAEFDRAGFAAFESDYLAELGPDGDPCLFGCNSGYSGSSPDVAGEGYREYLVHSDLLMLARMLYFSSDALDHLERSTGLLQAYRESYLAEKARAALTLDVNDSFYDRAWTDYAGCTAQVTPPILPAAALRVEVEYLRYRGSLSADERKRFDAVDQVLRQMTSEDD
jgi:hypothetical protein